MREKNGNAEFLSRTFFMSYVSVKQILLLERYCFLEIFVTNTISDININNTTPYV